MKVELELDEIQLGWLEAAVTDLHHKMTAASKASDYVVSDIEERMRKAQDLWDQVSAYSGLR